MGMKEQSTKKAPLEPLASLELPKQIRRGIRECTKTQAKAHSDITYLWIHVSKAGIAQPADGAISKAPGLEHWLNVVDEAAAFGANWLVVTMDTSFTAYPDIWTVCQWAQETHDMEIGLHTNVDAPAGDEIEAISQLNPARTRVFVKRSALSAFAPFEAAGFRVSAADPQPYGHHPDCRGAQRLVFVAPDGALYTCGLVEGNENYKLGNIFEDRFDQLLRDPSLPHAVAENIHRVSSGCDGCPSLIANFLARED